MLPLTCGPINYTGFHILLSASHARAFRLYNNCYVAVNIILDIRSTEPYITITSKGLTIEYLNDTQECIHRSELAFRTSLSKVTTRARDALESDLLCSSIQNPGITVYEGHAQLVHVDAMVRDICFHTKL